MSSTGCFPRIFRKRQLQGPRHGGNTQTMKKKKEVDINDMDFTDERRTWQNSMRDSQTGARYPGFSFTIVSSKDFRGSNSFRLSQYMPKFLQSRPVSTAADSTKPDTTGAKHERAPTPVHVSLTSQSLRSSYSSDGLTDEDDFSHRHTSYESTTDEDDFDYRLSIDSDVWKLPGRSAHTLPSGEGSSARKLQKPALPTRRKAKGKSNESRTDLVPSGFGSSSLDLPVLQVGPEVGDNLQVDPSLVPPPPPFPPTPEHENNVMAAAAADCTSYRKHQKPTIEIKKQSKSSVVSAGEPSKDFPLSPSRNAAMKGRIVKNSLKHENTIILPKTFSGNPKNIPTLGKKMSGLSKLWPKQSDHTKPSTQATKTTNTHWQRTKSGKWKSEESGFGGTKISCSPRNNTSKTNPWDHHLPQHNGRWQNMMPILEDNDV